MCLHVISDKAVLTQLCTDAAVSMQGIFKYCPKNKPLNLQLFLLTTNVWNRHILPILKSLHSLAPQPVVDPHLLGWNTRIKWGSGMRWGQRWVEDEGWGEVRHCLADKLYVTRSYMFTTLTHLREGHPSFLKCLLLLWEFACILNNVLNLQWVYSFTFMNKQCVKMLLQLFYIWTFRELNCGYLWVWRYPNQAHLIWLDVYWTLR